MSQLNTDAILRRLAELTQAAWPDVAGRIAIGRPLVGMALPCAAVVCDRVAREGAVFVRKNSWSFSITVFGRFAYPESGSIQAAKDLRLNDLYGEIQPQDGKLRSGGGDVLLEMVRVSQFDLTDYTEEDGVKGFDVAMTVVGTTFPDV